MFEQTCHLSVILIQTKVMSHKNITVDKQFCEYLL